jgi:transposase InsO family protein
MSYASAADGIRARRFYDLGELQSALSEFRSRYNANWILGRLKYRTPSQAREDFSVQLPIAA